MIRWKRERTKESKSWMLETRSEGSIMKSRCYSKRITFTSCPNLDGWSGEAYEAGRIGLVCSQARRTQGYFDTGGFPYHLAEHCDTMNY